MITARLDWADRRRLDFAGYDVRTRLARVITELADRHGYETSQGYELGVQLSSSTESLSARWQI
jgi:CRP/FNR family cyclic AMP-dependent transcriptional regulator